MPIATEGDRSPQRASEGVGASGASLGANLMAFLAWWRGELAGLAPSSWRGSQGRSGPVATVQELDGQIVLKRKSGAAGLPLAPGSKALRSVPRNGAVYLLAEDAALRRERRLPSASRAHIQSIMNLQLASDTPFTIDEVYADSIVTGEDEAAREIIVSQALAPRAPIDAIVDDMRQTYGIQLAAIDLADSATASGRAGYNLLPAAMRPPVKSRATSGARLLLLVLAGSAIFAGFAWRDLQQRRIAAADALVASAETGASDAMQVSTRVAQGVGGIQKLAAEQSDPLGFLRVYNTVAALLPDGTWLEEFAYERPTATLTGLSGNSATLVAAFEASDMVASARFASPIVTDSQSGAERFRLEITFRGAVGDASPAEEAAP